MKIVHDQFTQFGGAEKVALVISQILKVDQIYTSLSNSKIPFLETNEVRLINYWKNPSKIELNLPQLFPGKYQNCFLQIGAAFKEDRMIVSSTGWAHLAALRNPFVTTYCHSPNRVMYFPEELKNPAVTFYSKKIYSMYRQRDQEAMLASSLVLTNSKRSAERISMIYGISAKVVYPPAKLFSTLQTPIQGLPNEFVLVVGRNRKYKNHEILERVAKKLNSVNFVFVGGKSTRQQGPIYRIGRVKESELVWLYSNCKFVIAIGEEDLGLVPAEAASFGKPSLGLRGFGAQEVIVDGKSGFFCDLSEESIADGIDRLSNYQFDELEIVATSHKFSIEEFASNLTRALDL